MAEALINHYLKESWQAFSAGTHPSHVHPKSIAALEEIGIATKGLRSKSLSEFWDREDLDLIVTVCDNAKESCPVFYKPIPQVHLSLPDPVTLPADEHPLQGFRQVREMIIHELFPLLQERG
jgi:arsenate reductase